MKQDIFLDSSMVEHSAVNRVVVGSSPTRGVFLSDTLDTPSGDNTRLHGQAVKTSPFHGGNTGSNPVGVIFFNKEHIILIWRRSQVVRQWSATPVSTGSNPVCASPERPRKLIVSGVFSCPENLCVTNLYIAETRIKSRVTGIFLCFKIAILIPLYQ